MINRFRVWDKINKRFLTRDTEFAILSNGNLIISDTDYYEGFTNSSLCDFEIQQFTGLTDENGVEIYEGDYINHPYGVSTVEFGRYLSSDGLAHVGFYLDFASKNIGLDGSIEIIGNIFENPELLK